jgi:hypothetical protein
MSTNSSQPKKAKLTHTGLAVLAAIIVIAVLTSVNERLGVSDILAFWALFLVGVFLCGAGPSGQGATYGWWNPLHIIGYVIGAVLLLLAVAIMFGLTVPGISSVQSATMVVAALMVVKGVVAMFYQPPAA